MQVYSLSSLPAFRVDFRVMSDDNTFINSSENFNIATWNMKVPKKKKVNIK